LIDRDGECDEKSSDHPPYRNVIDEVKHRIGLKSCHDDPYTSGCIYRKKEEPGNVEYEGQFPEPEVNVGRLWKNQVEIDQDGTNYTYTKGKGNIGKYA
jgi:hypothetical protein